MKVKDVMTTNVFTSTPDSNLKDVADKMKELNVGAIPVVQEGKPVGIITDRDIVLRTISEDKNPFSAKAADVMSVDLVLAAPEMDVDDAAALMSRHRIRRLPVVENGKLVGIISLGDLAAKSHLADEAGKALSDISHPIGPDLQ
ncbi:MAG TPA: CBS domain-containing protein [Clostridia bacterium]|jgi:CBS domain-containing protein|nr:CBS domain-containing protein [Clostridia bacterium]